MNRFSRNPRSGRAALRLMGDQRGQAVAEFALVLPLLAILLLGIVEFGRAFEIAHSLSVIGREGANIAARGTAMDTVLQVVIVDGAQIGLAANGGGVVSKIEVQSGIPVVTAQVSTQGFGQASRIGGVNASVTALSGLGLTEGSVHYAVETFYNYQALTPVGVLLSGAIPGQLYSRSFF